MYLGLDNVGDQNYIGVVTKLLTKIVGEKLFLSRKLSGKYLFLSVKYWTLNISDGANENCAQK